MDGIANLREKLIQEGLDLYRKWQSVGTDGNNFAEPELYRSVGIDEIEQNNWTLVPSKLDTKANMDGVPLDSYKVVNSREFTYVPDTSRRGDKIALAFNRSEQVILYVL